MRPPVIAYADGADSPRSAPRDVAAVAGLSDPEVLLGWTPEGRPWLASPALRGRTVIAGYALAGAVADGRLHYMPVRLSAVPRMVTDLRPDVALVTGIRRGDRPAFGASAGWGPAAARAATMVVVELDDAAADVGGPEIPGRIVATVPRPPSAEPPPALPTRSTRSWSTIVPHVGVVSTPRCDVELVVTEHGVADLRGVDDAERVRRVLAVAAPEHRAWLERSARR